MVALILMASALNVLVVDDDPDDHFFFNEALRLRGRFDLKVKNLTNGLEVINLLTKLEKNASDYFLPDFIILDLHMATPGNPIDGLKLLQLIKSDSRISNTPIFMFRQVNEPLIVQFAYKLGCDAYYDKNCSIEDVARTIDLMVERYYELKDKIKSI